MHSFSHALNFQAPLELLDSIGEIGKLGAINMLFLHRTNEGFHQAILSGFAFVGNTDLDAPLQQRLNKTPLFRTFFYREGRKIHFR